MKTKVQRKLNNLFRFWTSVVVFQNICRYVLSRRLPFMVGWCSSALIFLNLTNFGLCNNNNNINNIDVEDNDVNNNVKYANESLVEARKLLEDSSSMVWSEFLEDYVLSQSSSSRASKDLPLMSNINEVSGPGSAGYHMTIMNPNMGGHQHYQGGPINYHSSAYKQQQRLSAGAGGGGGTGGGNAFITKRIGDAVELEPHMRPPVHVVNPQFRPMTNQMIQQQQERQTPGFLQQLFGIGGGSSSINGPQQQPPLQQPQMRPVPLQQHPVVQQPHSVIQQQPQQHNGPPQPFRAISENDLYLLGAIEKLVYRVDYLESRVRRSEQLIYYLMAGNNQKELRDPCPTNFTRISDNCYYINSHQQVNWKTANSACKALNAHLAEFEKVTENEEIMAYLLNQPNHRGRDYWLGGLNPGLLWIWSNSAKPVNPNMNLTSIAMSHKNGASNSSVSSSTAESNAIDDGKDEKPKPDSSTTETILNNTIEIKGSGRCLRLSYNSAKHSYAYYGQECTSRHHYICESEDKTLDNRIKKITRDLKLFD